MPVDVVCTAMGKTCYSYAEARARAKQARRRFKEPIEEYRCATCSWWHFGHSRRAGRMRDSRRVAAHRSTIPPDGRHSAADERSSAQRR